MNRVAAAASIAGLVLLLGLAVLRGRSAGATLPPAGEEQEAFLPAVWIQRDLLQATPTLGPSPTPTRTATRTPTATAGPAPTATATPPASFRIEQAVIPESGIVGTEMHFTLGLLNSLEVPVQVTLINTLPDGIVVDQIWPPTGTAIVVAADCTVFTATLVVPRQWPDNLFFVAHVAAPPCSRSCYVQNAATWTASWAGGGNSGTSLGEWLWLVKVTPTPTPVTPSPTPTVTWTPWLSPTPSAGPTPTETLLPTLGPSPTPGK